MAKSLRATIKAFFQTGDVPTQSEYVDTLDSEVFWIDDVKTDLTTNSDDYVPTVKAVVDSIADYVPLAGTLVGSPIAGNLEIKNDGEYYITQTDGTYHALLSFLQGGSILIAGDSNGADQVLWQTDPSNNQIKVTGPNATFKGVVYTGDYSANFTNRSLVDKEYVDNLAPSADTALIIDITKAALNGLFAGFDVNPKAIYRITNATAGVVRVFGVSTGAVSGVAFLEGSFDGSVLTSGQWGNYQSDTDTFTSIITAASIGAIVDAATNYATPLDADKIGVWDDANSLFKATTIANFKANVFKDSFTLTSFAGTWTTPADSLTYYLGTTGGITIPLTTITTFLSTLNFAFKITGIIAQHTNNVGTVGTAENVIVGIRNNTDAVNTTLITIQTNQASGVCKYFEDQSLNIDIPANKACALYVTTPAWATNPTNIVLRITLFIQKT